MLSARFTGLFSLVLYALTVAWELNLLIPAVENLWTHLLDVWAVPVNGVTVVPVNRAQVCPGEREEVEGNRRESHYNIPAFTCTCCGLFAFFDSQSHAKPAVFTTFLRLSKWTDNRKAFISRSRAAVRLVCSVTELRAFPNATPWQRDRRSSKASWAGLLEFTLTSYWIIPFWD